MVGETNSSLSSLHNIVVFISRLGKKGDEINSKTKRTQQKCTENTKIYDKLTFPWFYLIRVGGENKKKKNLIFFFFLKMRFKPQKFTLRDKKKKKMNAILKQRNVSKQVAIQKNFSNIFLVTLLSLLLLNKHLISISLKKSE